MPKRKRNGNTTETKFKKTRKITKTSNIGSPINKSKQYIKNTTINVSLPDELILIIVEHYFVTSLKYVILPNLYEFISLKLVSKSFHNAVNFIINNCGKQPDINLLGFHDEIPIHNHRLGAKLTNINFLFYRTQHIINNIDDFFKHPQYIFNKYKYMGYYFDIVCAKYIQETSGWISSIIKQNYDVTISKCYIEEYKDIPYFSYMKLDLNGTKHTFEFVCEDEYRSGKFKTKNKNNEYIFTISYCNSIMSTYDIKDFATSPGGNDIILGKIETDDLIELKKYENYIISKVNSIFNNFFSEHSDWKILIDELKILHKIINKLYNHTNNLNY